MDQVWNVRDHEQLRPASAYMLEMDECQGAGVRDLCDQVQQKYTVDRGLAAAPCVYIYASDRPNSHGIETGPVLS
jgi:hypothetical protein